LPQSRDGVRAGRSGDLIGKKGNGSFSGRRFNRNQFQAATETVAEQFNADAVQPTLGLAEL
jgi:hypothetical protein